MTPPNPFIPQLVLWHAARLTKRWAAPLAVVMSTFDFMKQFSIFAAPAAASGGSGPSR